MTDRPATTITKFVDELAHVMLKLAGYVMLFAPIGVFGAVAAAITTQGLGVLATYGKFIGTFYVALAVLWCVLIAAGFVFLGGRVFELLRALREPMLIAFTNLRQQVYRALRTLLIQDRHSGDDVRWSGPQRAGASIRRQERPSSSHDGSGRTSSPP